MIWKQDIAGCFGEVDQLFAIHPLDDQRAFDLLIKLRRERPGWEDIEEAFRDHLQSQGCNADHIDEQLEAVRRHYRAGSEKKILKQEGTIAISWNCRSTFRRCWRRDH